MAVTRTHFTCRIDMWTTNGESIVEHVAGVEDYQVALATYRAACERWPGIPITLRQGARVIEDSRRLRVVYGICSTLSRVLINAQIAAPAFLGQPSVARGGAAGGRSPLLRLNLGAHHSHGAFVQNTAGYGGGCWANLFNPERSCMSDSNHRARWSIESSNRRLLL